MMKAVPVLLGLLVVAACGPAEAEDVGSDGLDDDAGSVLLRPLREIVADPTTEVTDRVQAALEMVAEDHCFREASDLATCSWSKQTLEKQFIAEQPNSEAVLIIDHLPPAVDYLRYRHRIFGHYAVERGGSIKEEPVVIRMLTTLGEIMTGFANYPSVRADALGQLFQPLRETYDTRFAHNTAAHGVVVFSVLKELVPNHPIVLLSHSEVVPQLNELQCALSSDAQGKVDTTPLRVFTDRYAAELKRLIASHNIRFINASWGTTLQHIRRAWERCGKAYLATEENQLAVLQTWMPVYEVLFATPGVLAVQAAVEDVGLTDAPLDRSMPELFNRLRVGSFGYLGEDISPEGAMRASADWDVSPRDTSAADVYVNDGVISRRSRARGYFSPVHAFGVQEQPPEPWLLPVSTSFITPVALARVIAMRQSARFRQREMSNGLIEEMLDVLMCRSSAEGASRCVFWDPLLHLQFDAWQ
jgi:hypothetical protein